MNLLSKALFFIISALIILSAITLGACTDSTDFDPPSAPPEATQEPTTPQSPSDMTGWVEVVYFHRTNRCSSCIYAEEGTRYTIQTYFGDELARGKLVFKVLDLQEEANAAYLRKYEAHTSSLFINEVKDGIDHIEEVSDIWTKLGRDEAFIEVVKSAIEKHLGGI